MAPNQPKVPRPGQAPGVARPKASIEAFQPSSHDIIYPEGEIIDINPDEQCAFIVRVGSIATEMIIPAPGGLKKIDLDTVEAGEYFNVHALFGFILHENIDLRYRAQCRTVIMRVTGEMLPNDPQKLNVILRSFMQTAARREGKLRQLTGYALQRTEEKRAERKNEATTDIQKLQEQLHEKEKRIQELESANGQTNLYSELGMRLTEAQNSNAALRRDIKKLQQDIARLVEDLKQERLVRNALEKKNIELLQQVASQSSAISSAKFPSASHLLESTALEELEQDAKKFRAAADYFEDLANKMHRSMELIAEDNPGMFISEDVMMLMTGQEPPPRRSVQIAKASRNSNGFKTITLGSASPEAATAEASSSGDIEHTNSGPHAMSSQELKQSNYGRKPAITAIETPDALKRNKNTSHRSNEHCATPDTSPLSGSDVNALLEEFIADPTANKNSNSSQGVDVPYPELKTPGIKTLPFIPDDDHLPTNSNIEIPPQPATPRVSQPSPACEFPYTEADSDITPVVPELPPDNKKDTPGMRSWIGIPDGVKGQSVQPEDKQELAWTDEADSEVREILEDWRGIAEQPQHEERDHDMNDSKWTDNENKRSTRAYDFPAPGKPPRPKQK